MKKSHSRSQSNTRAFRHFLASPCCTLHDINVLLKKDGLGPIAQRSFTHLKNLRKAGLTEYMTINAFDLKKL